MFPPALRELPKEPKCRTESDEPMVPLVEAENEAPIDTRLNTDSLPDK